MILNKLLLTAVQYTMPLSFILASAAEGVAKAGELDLWGVIGKGGIMAGMAYWINRQEKRHDKVVDSLEEKHQKVVKSLQTNLDTERTAHLETIKLLAKSQTNGK